MKAYLSKDSDWKGFIELFPKDSKVRSILEGTKSPDDFFKKIFDPVKNVVAFFDKNRVSIRLNSMASAETKKPDTPDVKSDEKGTLLGNAVTASVTTVA